MARGEAKRATRPGLNVLLKRLEYILTNSNIFDCHMVDNAETMESRGIRLKGSRIESIECYTRCGAEGLYDVGRQRLSRNACIEKSK